jgi:hypothetical protein
MLSKAMEDWKKAVVLSVKESKYDTESWGLLVRAAIDSKTYIIDITEGKRTSQSHNQNSFPQSVIGVEITQHNKLKFFGILQNEKRPTCF